MEKNNVEDGNLCTQRREKKRFYTRIIPKEEDITVL